MNEMTAAYNSWYRLTACPLYNVRNHRWRQLRNRMNRAQGRFYLVEEL